METSTDTGMETSHAGLRAAHGTAERQALRLTGRT